jgi:integrase
LKVDSLAVRCDSMSSTRIRRLPAGWYNHRLCATADCPAQAIRGMLCAEHQKTFLETSAALLAPWGVEPTGVMVDHRGYITVEHKSDGKRHRTLEHRLVMSRMLNRELLPRENVHHKNGDCSDNRPENLELWATVQPPGQRSDDLIAYANEILTRYKPPKKAAKKTAPRRTRGDGAFFQRTNGSWMGRVELPPKDGKRRYKWVSSKDRNTALDKLKKLRKEVDEGRIAVTSSTTVEKWLLRWLEEFQQPRLRPTTYADYRSVLTNHVIPAIGSKRLDKLTADHVRAMLKVIGPSRTAELIYVVLRKALQDACKEGILSFNVVERVHKPRYDRQRRTSMSVGVAKLVISTALASRDESESTRWAAAFLTGARQSELLGLRWAYVDLDHGYMDISWQLQQLTQTHGCGDFDQVWPCERKLAAYCPQRRWNLPPGFEHEPCHRSLLFTRPKTEAGMRLVPIVGPLLVPLRRMHADQGTNPHGLVWHRDDGKPIGPREDNRAWNQLLVDAEVIEPGKTLPLHLARHTTATLLRAAGVDEQTRMEILGHAQVDSQRVYAHGERERHQVAMSTLGELLS